MPGSDYLITTDLSSESDFWQVVHQTEDCASVDERDAVFEYRPMVFRLKKGVCLLVKQRGKRLGKAGKGWERRGPPLERDKGVRGLEKETRRRRKRQGERALLVAFLPYRPPPPHSSRSTVRFLERLSLHLVWLVHIRFRSLALTDTSINPLLIFPFAHLSLCSSFPLAHLSPLFQHQASHTFSFSQSNHVGIQVGRNQVALSCRTHARLCRY